MERRRWLGLLVGLACLGAMVWVVASLGPRRVVDVALESDPRWLALSFIPLIARYLIWGFKWWRILGRREAVPFGAAMRILIAGSFVNLTTPTARLAGGVLRAALLRRHYGWRLPGAYGRAFADQATSVLGTLALAAALAVGAAIANPRMPARAALLGAGALALLGLAAGAALRGWAWKQLQRPRVDRLLSRVAPQRVRDETDASSGRSAVQDVFFPLLGEGGTARTLLSDILWSAVSFLSLCLSGAMALRALGVETDLLLIAATVALGYFAGVLVGVWGGIGVTEAALTALYVQVGIPISTATAGALLHRAGFYLVVLVWGGTALWREGRMRT